MSLATEDLACFSLVAISLKDQATSSAVISPKPLWNWTPLRMLKVHTCPSAETLQLSASMGTNLLLSKAYMPRVSVIGMALFKKI